MSGFWKQYRILIAIFTVFLVLGIAPLVVMRFFPPEQSEQSETELPETETAGVSTEETVVEEPVIAESTTQRPFDRFLGTSSDETEEAENKENAENNVEHVEQETTAPLVPAQPEKILEIPVKPDVVIITTPPVVPTNNIDKKDHDHSISIKPETTKPEPVKPKPELVKPEPVNKEPAQPKLPKPESPKPELVKPEPIKQEPPKPQPNKIEATKTASDWIPFIYFYQQSPSGHQKLTLFPLAPKSEPVVIETKPIATLVPVIPVISVVPIIPAIPIIQVQPVYTPILVPITPYPLYL
jgi:hypothetical protein